VGGDANELGDVGGRFCATSRFIVGALKSLFLG